MDSDGGNQPVTVLKGVGPQLAAKLDRLGIATLQDLLFHLPFRYQDRTRVTPIGALRVGQEGLVVARVELAEVVFRRRRSLLVRISDDTGSLTMRLFHFSNVQSSALQRGAWVRCFGEVRHGPATLEMVHPEYRVFAQQPEAPNEETLTPVYPVTEGVGQATIRKLTDQVLGETTAVIQDWIPLDIRQSFKFQSLEGSLRFIHRPPANADITLLEQGQHSAQKRLAFEELLSHQLSLRQLREQRKNNKAPTLTSSGSLLSKFYDQLPFKLTGAQQRVIQEVLADLDRSHPALRLIQGDVGSGKTVVAAAAALWVIEANCQVALMAPTELLAEQHYKNFQQWFSPLQIQVAWLSGKMASADRRKSLSELAQGQASIVVGTHALFQPEVIFDKLGLIIVDEQHRFGVGQRLALREKGVESDLVPHQLTMTATPIPRTLAMAFYADIDISSIDELPPGRKPVETVVIPEDRRDEVLGRVSAACKQGQQAYWVCPVIDESDVLQVQAVTETYATISKSFPGLQVGLIHGRMKSDQKDQVMECFRRGETQVLVATTVIEVGVDVANASLMIIENAERLGLAQLHQLRGRVGRGNKISSCVLLYHPPLSPLSQARLAILRDTQDGFEIARRDLEQRGPGEVLGTRQTGVQQLHIADLVRDRKLLPEVTKVADLLRRKYPESVQPLIRRWLRTKQGYAHV